MFFFFYGVKIMYLWKNGGGGNFSYNFFPLGRRMEKGQERKNKSNCLTDKIVPSRVDLKTPHHPIHLHANPNLYFFLFIFLIFRFKVHK